MNRIKLACSAILAAGVVTQVVAAPPGTTGRSSTEIAAVLQKWSDSVENLRIRFEMTRTYSSNSPNAKLHRGHDYRYGYDWTWSETGKIRLYEWKRDAKEYVSDKLVTFDGWHFYTLNNPHGDPPTKLNDIQRAKPMMAGPPAKITPVALIHRLNGTAGDHQSLSELIRDTKQIYGRVTSVEVRGMVRLTITRPRVTFPRSRQPERSETECDRPPIPRPTAPQSNTETIRVTLDPQHGYLPREIERDGYRYTVTDFRFQRTPGIWIPSRGSLRVSSQGQVLYRHAWRATDVQVNAELGDSYFNPPIPEGAPVKEGDDVVAYEDPIKKQRELEKSQRRLWWLAILAGIVFAAVGVWMCLRTWRAIRS